MKPFAILFLALSIVAFLDAAPGYAQWRHDNDVMADGGYRHTPPVARQWAPPMHRGWGRPVAPYHHEQWRRNWR